MYPGANLYLHVNKQVDETRCLASGAAAGHTPAQVCYSAKMKSFVPALMLKKKKTYVVQHGDTFEKIESVHEMVSQPGGFYTFAKHIQVRLLPLLFAVQWIVGWTEI